MQHRALGRASFVIALVLLLSGARESGLFKATVLEDVEGGPVLCPPMLPPISGAYSSMTGLSFQVPKWQQPAGAEVTFTPHTYVYTTHIQPVLLGQGWYEVFPKETTWEGKTWYWQASSGVPGVLASCTRHWSWLLGWYTRVAWMGQVWGHAFPSDFDPPTITRPGGGGPQITGFECWELVQVGYDSFGQYYEIVLDSWCYPVYAE